METNCPGCEAQRVSLMSPLVGANAERVAVSLVVLPPFATSTRLRLSAGWITHVPIVAAGDWREHGAEEDVPSECSEPRCSPVRRFIDPSASCVARRRRQRSTRLCGQSSFGYQRPFRTLLEVHVPSVGKKGRRYT
jgi:hypothetical protein